MKTYFVKTDPTFNIILRWLDEEWKQQRLRLTGYSKAQLSGISSQDGTNTWTRMYDFTRTVAVVIRLMMLKATDLIRLCNPEISDGVRNNNEHRILLPSPRPDNVPINKGNHLAADQGEAQLLTASFDMMYTHLHLENKVNTMRVGESKDFTDQMIVVDKQLNMVWYFIIQYSIRKLNPPPPTPSFPTIGSPEIYLPDLNYFDVDVLNLLVQRLEGNQDIFDSYPDILQAIDTPPLLTLVSKVDLTATQQLKDGCTDLKPDRKPIQTTIDQYFKRESSY